VGWFDSHCHFDFADFDSDREWLWQQCLTAEVEGLLIPGVSRQQGLALPEFCTHQPRWFYALGLHPFFMQEHMDTDIDWLEQQLQTPASKLVAVGEVGLDWRMAPAVSQRRQQLSLLEAQVALARDFRLPLIVHGVASHDELAATLRRLRFDQGGVVHGFSGSLQQARRYLDLGLRLGMGGLISQPRAARVREALTALPLSSWLLETDAPDMTPRFWAEKRNSPLALPLLGVLLARHCQISVEELQNCLYHNLVKTFPKLAFQYK
jgi:TatD DNase family protein